METLQFGEIKLHWLNGGVTHMDGGAMFGVVPKPLWSKKYPVNEKNQIELRTDPIFFQYEGKNILIESGMGNGKLSDKQLRNYGVNEESNIEQELAKLNLTPDDIDVVLMTHLHFDHACGLTRPNGDAYDSVFKNAKIYTSITEWNEMRNPNVRSKNTYWEMNWKGIESQIQTFQDRIEVLPGLHMIHTGGHSDGHSIIVFEQGDERLVHMADLMPTHAHKNPLWVLAYDDYPMTSIGQKQEWIPKGMTEGAWFTFYHDAIYRAIQFNADGEIVDVVKRNI
ncbi:YtnP family quorum-quenching lactonase [Pseudalkalibacillus berkeleyi]|uniref:MBL fold metallo-hydrolase n=1 Tax=Pseudalkalibacillus berkeleyi TaxID=1069813 RepID=A0ABS9H3U7_9BACL|nr:MBL fold metallo-hydrolase [Pseudalkalibacillus berkeleyi]MCF6138325.1 MBL fold metallo-hydrolase [Pseudalkalibacillus berkeleyi]